MTICVDLRGFRAAGRSRRTRALTELASLAAAAGPTGLRVVADGEAAFAARLAVGPGTHVGPEAPTNPAAITYRAFGEANPAPMAAGPILVEAGDLGRLVDADEGPSDRDAVLADRLHALAEAERVIWRVAVEWQADVLRSSLGVAPARILPLPSRVALPPADRLRSLRLPAGLPPEYLLCLTPVGPAGDHAGLVRAFRSLGPAAPVLVVLGVDDQAWLPALSGAIARAGMHGRVLLLRDLDPLSEVAAIGRARAVVALDRHPAHAVRLRQAAGLHRPAAVRRHPGHAAWVDGGRWFDDDGHGLATALTEPASIRPGPDGDRTGGQDPLIDRLIADGDA
ncbi:MAG: hypothetical protein RLO51_06055 [Thalassobaculum sp.]|uniref:hypothetical protein n=1 Tax=Thalassobaculum sp. TaxID=2022740 RepID=UPI0032EDF9E9